MVKQVSAILLLCLSALSGPAPVAEPSADLLSPAERDWLAEHPDIVLGVGEEWAPWVIRQADGHVTGFAADHLALLGRKLGIRLGLVAGPWHEMVRRAEARELAGLTLSAPLPEREAHFRFTQTFHKTHYFIFRRTGDPGAGAGLEDLVGMRVGYLRGVLAVEKLLARQPGVQTVPMNTHAALARALLEGDLDAVTDSYALEHWRASNGVLGFAPQRILLEDAPTLVISVRRDWPELAAILDKGLSAVTSEENAALHRRWFGSDYLSRAGAGRIALTAAERDWLAAHPELEIGAPADQPPAVVVHADGRLEGLVADYVALLNQRLGTEIRVVTGTWPEVLERSARRELDMLGFTFRLDAHRRHFDFTSPVLRTYYYIYVRSDEPSPPTDLRALAGRRVGYTTATRIVEEVAGGRADIELIPFDDTRSLAEALLARRVDAVLANVAFEYWRKRNTQTGFRIAALVPEIGGELVIAVRRDWPELTAILNRGLASIDEEERSAILERWLGSGTPLGPEEPALALTAQERAWLDRHRVLRAGIHPGRAPLEMVDEQGVPQGIATAWLDLVEGLLDVRFEPVVTGGPGAAGGDAEPDVLPAVAAGSDQARGRLLTAPYLTLPAVIFSAADVAYLGDLGALTGRTVAVVRDDPAHDWLAADWPGLSLVTVSDAREGLRKLAEGEVFALVGNLITTSHAIGQSGLTQVKVVGDTPYDYRVSMAVGGDHPVLAGILDKALAAIPKQQRDAIYNEWVSIRYQHGVDYRLLWQVVAAGVLVLLVILYWNRRLVREVERRRRAEGALREAKDAADRASRSKSELLANVSHDLRTPLNSVLGFAQVLEQDGGLDERQRRHLEGIRRGGERLLGLVDEVLDLTRIESGRLELSPVTWHSADLLDEISDLFRARAERKGIALCIAPAPGLPQTLCCDVKCLHQILANLIDNAVKFSDGGAVTVSAGYENGCLVLTVSDTGPGIPEDRLATIFEPFQQVGATGTRSEGLGLGLAITRRLVERMGGSLSVTSEVGAGSLFRVRIPAEIRAAEPARESPGAGRIVGYRRTTGSGPLRVVVADDEAENRGVLRALLAPLGFALEEVSTGRECLERALAQPPDLILMDLRMPDLGGIEATRLLRADARTRPVPIVAITAAAFEEDRDRALAAGCDAHLPKPVRLGALAEIIETLLPLSWERAPVSVGPASPPPPEALPPELAARFARLLGTGNVSGIGALAEELRRSGACPVLARRMGALAEEFDLEGLEGLLSGSGSR